MEGRANHKNVIKKILKGVLTLPLIAAAIPAAAYLVVHKPGPARNQGDVLPHPGTLESFAPTSGDKNLSLIPESENRARIASGAHFPRRNLALPHKLVNR